MLVNTAIWILMLGMSVFEIFLGVLMLLSGLVAVHHKSKLYQLEILLALILMLMSFYVSYKMTKETIALFGIPFCFLPGIKGTETVIYIYIQASTGI